MKVFDVLVLLVLLVAIISPFYFIIQHCSSASAWQNLIENGNEVDGEIVSCERFVSRGRSGGGWSEQEWYKLGYSFTDHSSKNVTEFVNVFDTRLDGVRKGAKVKVYYLFEDGEYKSTLSILNPFDLKYIVFSVLFSAFFSVGLYALLKKCFGKVKP